MVVHFSSNLSSKLSHLAQSFRPQQHFNFIRNAVPSSGSSTTTYTNSSLGQAGNGQAAGTGSNGSAGGAGGAKYNAGNRSHPNWGFQSQGRTVQAGTTDPNRLSDEEQEQERLRFKRLSLLGSTSSRSVTSSSKLRTRQRSNSLSGASSVGVELLSVEEVGLSRVRLSGSEMQRRYRSALSKGERTQELKEMEADEMDFGPPSSVVTSGRRASISRSMVSTPARSITSTLFTSSTTSTLSSSSPQQRTLHTTSFTSTPIPSTSPFASTSPPIADTPRVRRNSTSAVASTSPSLLSDSTPSVPSSSSPPSSRSINIDEAIKSPKPKSPIVRRPKNTSAKDAPSLASVQQQQEEHQQGLARAYNKDRRSHLNVLEQATTSRMAENAVRAYLAFPAEYSTENHNAAMAALHRNRSPEDPIEPIIDLFNQLFNHASLKPNKESFSQMLKTFIERDSEILKNIHLLEKRELKKRLVGKARGPLDRESESFVDEKEAEELARLRAEDYFTKALKMFKTLGSKANDFSNALINSLVVAAVLRNRLDEAIALFSRLESLPSRYPDGSSYIALIQAFAKEKDVAGVMEIFESYLEARGKGLPELPKYTQDTGSKYDLKSTKHRYDTQIGFEERRGAKFGRGANDSIVWETTIESLFVAGDSVAAVELIERMMNQTEGKRTRGYPALDDSTFEGMIKGFLIAGDEESAQRWFDKVANPLTKRSRTDSRNATVGFLIKCYSAALDRATLTFSPASADFFNHVYRSLLQAPGNTLSVGQFVTAIDVNLAVMYSSEDPIVQNRLVDAVMEFKAAYVSKQPEVGLSTGLQQRIISALSHIGRFDEVADAYVNYAEDILAAINYNEGAVEVARSNKTWVLRSTTTTAMVALGLIPLSDITRTYNFEFNGSFRPSLRNVTAIIECVSKITLAGYGESSLPNTYAALVAESYGIAKAEAKGDVASLGLSGRQWFTIIEAFAYTARFGKNVELQFDFPGFETIVDDFVASGVLLKQSEGHNFSGMVQALNASGMSKARILAVISVLDSRVGDAIAKGEIDLSKLPPPPPPPSAPTPSSVESPAPVIDLRPLPTAPTTPPTYFNTLSTPVPEFALDPALDPAASAPSLSIAASRAVEEEFDCMKAYRIAAYQASQGKIAHPDSLGRLVERLGREHHLEEVRHIYVLAYTALSVLSFDPLGQSQSWVSLEDHMIIALAQMGAIAEVNVHRNRLIAAGSAPSADGYAAMILNMKETTDDAAVALELFEESQRYQVAPNVYLFNTLISKLSRARRSKEAVTYFELMKASGLVPSSITYGAVINACCKAGDSVTADFLFREMIHSPGFKPRVPPYNTMIQFYTQTQPDREKALYYYDQLLVAGVQPTGHTYKLLLDAYGAIGVPDAQSMSDVFDRLVQDKKVTVTGAHWASLVNAWGCVQQDLDRATSIFDSIAHHPSTRNSPEPLPDAVVYESLLNACLANQKPDLCAKYLAQMKENGIKLTAYLCNTLLKAYASQNDMVSARALFESMTDPAAGVAAEGNHIRERHPKHLPSTSSSTSSDENYTVQREPSTWQIMVQSELGAGEVSNALHLLKRVRDRAYPAAVVARIERVLTENSVTILPEVTTTTSS